MNIISYEPYHIGIKLKEYVNMKNLKLQLIKYMKNKKYIIKKIDYNVPFEIVRETIASKNNVEIEFFYERNAINIIKKASNDKKEVIDIFHDINNGLTSFNYDLKNTVSFYEIVSNVVVSIKGEPIKNLNNIFNISFDKFLDYGNYNFTGFKLRSQKDEKNFFDLVFEPKLTNPGKLYYIRAVFRTEDISKLDTTDKLFDKEIKTIMSTVGLMS